MTTRLAIFDCDGTLIESQANICEAMEEAFASVALEAPARPQIRRAIGLSLPSAVARLLPDGDEVVRREIVEAYKQAFRAARTRGSISQPLIPGILPVLEALRHAGWQLGVATGMSSRGLNHCLATHDIAAMFATLQTADTNPSKPDPATLQAALFETAALAGDAVMIGDTAFDMMAAGNAGVRPVGVAWGYHEPEELARAGAEFIAATPAELSEYLLA